MVRNVQVERDLGMQLSDDLKWHLEVITIANKANSVLGMLKRTFVYSNENISKRHICMPASGKEEIQLNKSLRDLTRLNTWDPRDLHLLSNQSTVNAKTTNEFKKLLNNFDKEKGC